MMVTVNSSSCQWVKIVCCSPDWFIYCSSMY